MENLIELNCHRCINYELCQSTGCSLKIEIERLLKNNDHLKDIKNKIKVINDEGKNITEKDIKEILQIIETTGNNRDELI